MFIWRAVRGGGKRNNDNNNNNNNDDYNSRYDDDDDDDDGGRSSRSSASASGISLPSHYETMDYDVEVNVNVSASSQGGGKNRSTSTTRRSSGTKLKKCVSFESEGHDDFDTSGMLDIVVNKSAESADSGLALARTRRKAKGDSYSSSYGGGGIVGTSAFSLQTSTQSSTVVDETSLSYTRLRAMNSLKQRGNAAMSTERYVQVSRQVHKTSSRGSSRLNDSVLSQFSPYIVDEDEEEEDKDEHGRITSPDHSGRSSRASNPSSRSGLGGSVSSLTEESLRTCFGDKKRRPKRSESTFLPAHLHGAPTKRSTQIALQMFQNMQIYNSQNYEPSDSSIDRTAALNLPRRHYIMSNLYRWLLALVIGLTMGVITFVMYTIMSLLIGQKLKWTQEFITRNNSAAAIGFFVGAGALLVLFATLPVSFFQPIAAGSGIAEMKVYLNGIHVPGLLRISTLATKAFSLCCSIPSGMVVGTAGPYVHLGAIVGGGIGSLGSNSFKFKLNKGHVDFQSKFAHRSFVTIGIAAGTAAVFTAPIGGVLIAYEDCGSFYLGSTKMFWQCFLATCSGVFINQILTLLYKRDALGINNFDTTQYTRAFALYDDSTARYSQVYRYSWWEVISFALMGCLAGLAGSLFVNLHMRVHRLRGRFLPASNPWKRSIEALFLGVMTAAVTILVCYFSPCEPLPENIQEYPMTEEGLTLNGTSTYENENLNQLWCDPGSYSAFGTIFLQPAGVSLKEILHLGETVNQQDQFTTGSMAAYMFFIYIFLILTYGCSIAGGTMVPLLTCGSTYGRLCAKLAVFLLSKAGATTSASNISFATYSVIGAASLQSGASRMTLSIAVLVLETCGALELTIPLMITIFFAKAVGDWTGTGLYDAYIALKGVPYLPEDEISYEQKMISEKLDVQEIMTSDLVCLPPVTTVGQVVQVLKTCKHSAFPVLEKEMDVFGDSARDEGGFPTRNMVGYIFRSQLLNMLDKGIGFVRKGETEYDLSDNHKDVLGLVEDMKDLPIKRDAGSQDEVIKSLTQEDTERCMDLRPFMQLDPCIISSNANVAKAYRLFQKMGLSHLYVAPAGPRPVVGVITRKDLTFENCQLQLGERASYEMKALRSRERISSRSMSGGEEERREEGNELKPAGSSF